MTPILAVREEIFPTSSLVSWCKTRVPLVLFVQLVLLVRGKGKDSSTTEELYWFHWFYWFGMPNGMGVRFNVSGFTKIWFAGSSGGEGCVDLEPGDLEILRRHAVKLRTIQEPETARRGFVTSRDKVETVKRSGGVQIPPAPLC